MDFFGANEFNNTNGRGTMHRAPTIGSVVCDGGDIHGSQILFDIVTALFAPKGFQASDCGCKELGCRVKKYQINPIINPGKS